MGGNGFQWRDVSWQAWKGCPKVTVPGRPFQVSINCQQSSSFPCEVWGKALGGSCMCINFGRDGDREPALLSWQICFYFSREPSQCQLKYLQGGSNAADLLPSWEGELTTPCKESERPQALGMACFGVFTAECQCQLNESCTLNLPQQRKKWLVQTAVPPYKVETSLFSLLGMTIFRQNKTQL